MKQRNMSSISDSILCGIGETNGQFGADLFTCGSIFEFGGHVDVSLYMQSWGMVIFMSLRSDIMDEETTRKAIRRTVEDFKRIDLAKDKDGSSNEVQTLLRF